MSTWFAANRRGFTLIELLITVSLMALILAAASVFIGRARSASRDSRRIGDILVISKAIDSNQALTGTYPKNAAHPANISLMCADEIYTSANPNRIDVTSLTQHSIPTDPLPLQTGRGGAACSTARQGYLYHTEYGYTSALASSPTYIADFQNVAYSLEVLLELQKPDDENQLKSGTDLNQPSITTTDTASGRFRYILNGRFCGTGSTPCYQ